MDDLSREIRKIALKNALEHGGTAREGTVMARLLGTRPELRNIVGEIRGDVAEAISAVNAMSADAQRAEIESEFPEAAVKTRPDKPSRPEGLPELENAQDGVVTRFPPEPNGYPHIGHAKAAIINSEYVEKYGGRKILRMDDTNPGAERLEYYAAIKVGLEWLGIQYDTIKNTSDDMDLLLNKGDELIRSGDAYVCTCKRDEMSRRRREMTECSCRDTDAREDAKRWSMMSNKYKTGQAVVRLRGTMTSPNTVMRDPVLFRILDERHPLLAKRYRVWPSYDFAVAIEDSVDGVTHAFRSKEYELRNELYYTILDSLHMRKPQVLEFSRLEFKGMPVSKRILKSLIEEGKVSWYDDPRLPTLEALRRRGVSPGAVRRFVISLGLTKADTLAPFEALESFNRSEIDASSVRLFMVDGPRAITIAGLPSTSVTLQNHPTRDLGTRRVEVGPHLMIRGRDAEKLKIGDRVRLLGLGDIRIEKTGRDLWGAYDGDDPKLKHPKMQWVPQDSPGIKIMIPGPLFEDDSFNEASLREADVLVEPHYMQIPEGAMIQFVRFGYCRKESQKIAIYTHG